MFETRRVNLRRGVVVLEEVEVGATSVLHLEADCLSSGALEGRNQVGVARGDRGNAVVLLDLGSIAEGSLRSSGRLQHGEIDLAVAAEGVRRGLEVLLLGEQEDETAGLAGVRGRNVKVEDARDGGRDCAVERGARSLVGRRGVDGYDQVGEFILSGEIGRAAGDGRLGGRGRMRRLRSRASGSRGLRTGASWGG